ncbi:alpha/beta fold hydrolase [Kushneria indalinina]|uniref:Pimeloyl-ACP methyl ester carboxylesterase n=1 Tax=Kushneria indalinina DSM 14324 TaxID=1122140 RepID=A0A3D9DV82_9GAMM|nr:alpha/beta fold hydrolase [Kushneria indalinina]REC94657.1 pimeloyl-ACP methyl ester carboxylesterase [Kushneria indalinina DSM 14324]
MARDFPQERTQRHSRRRSHKGRWALAGLAASMAWASWQKRQAIRATHHDRLNTAPELSRSAMVNGILMRWEEHGERSEQPPVVMLHGIPTNPRLWRHVIPRLVDTGTCCLAWELVGFGWSINEGLERDISVAAQVDYLIAWLNHQQIERATFVGHDIGGGVLQALLALYPERIAGLVLVDSVAFDNWPVPAVATAAQMAGVIGKLPPALLRPIFHKALTSLGHDNTRRETRSAALLWAPYSQPTGPAGFAHQARCMSAADTASIAARLPLSPTMPIAMVWGDQDPLSLASAERLAARISVPVIRRIQGGYHFNPEDHPDIVAEEVRRMITRVAQGPTADDVSDPTI